MIDNKIKNIIFDWGGVLINIDPAGCMAQFGKLGMKDVANAPIAFNDIMTAYETGIISTEEFRNEIRGIIGQHITNQQIDSAWNSMVLSVPEYKLQLLLELNRHYSVYLLSNTNSLHWASAAERVFKYKDFVLKDFFRQTFLSFEMKCKKPGKEIFTKALNEAGIKAEETLFIDDLKENCEAAQSVGINTLLYNQGQNLKELLEWK